MVNFQNYQAHVEWSKAVTKKVWIAKFKLENPQIMDFLAGQYCSFRIKDKLRRTFSFASSPRVKDSFEICADITPMGLGSTWIMNLKNGDLIDFIAPLGKFLIDKQSPRRRVFIATGTGIAPIRSMIYETLETETQNTKLEARLFWGLRYEEDIFWNEEFAEQEKKYANFRYFLTLSQPKEGWTGKKGYVTNHFEILGDLIQYDYYLCGNHETIDKIKEFLLAKNIPQLQIKTELFH